MALIPCPACDNQISQMATSCPACGHPIATTRPNLDHPKVQTVEQTSKGYKVGQLIGALMICAGVVACTARSVEASAWITLAGFVVYIVSRMGAWWNNG